MPKQFTPEQEKIIANLGAIVSGLQVPMSVGGPRLLGTAYEPTVAVRDQLRLFGYPSAVEVTKALRTALSNVS